MLTHNSLSVSTKGKTRIVYYETGNTKMCFTGMHGDDMLRLQKTLYSARNIHQYPLFSC